MEHTFVHTFIQQLALTFPSLIVVFTVWGWARSNVADYLGQSMMWDEDRLSINPLRQLNIVGVFILSTVIALFSAGGGLSMMFVFAWLVMIFFGVTVSPFEHIRGRIYDVNGSHFRLLWLYLVGPFSLFTLALLCMYIIVYGQFYVGQVGAAALQIVSSVMQWSLFIGVIRSVPFPPFEGAVLLPALFGQRGEDIVDEIEPYGLFIFLFLLLMPYVQDIFWGGLVYIIQFVKIMLLHLVI